MSVRRVQRADGTKVLSLREGPSEEVLRALGERGFDLLSIGVGNWADFRFLLPYSKEITRLMVSSPVDSYVGLEGLTELVDIDLEDAPDPPLDLLAFKRLESAFLKWHKKYPCAFFDLPELRQVTILGYSGADCGCLSGARKLQSCEFRQGRLTSLDGLETLQSLRSVSLSYIRGLVDISAIGKLRLRSLHLEKCPKLTGAGIIVELEELESLYIDSGAEGFSDLRWLRKNPGVESVVIAVPVETVDWELIFSLPRLRRFAVRISGGASAISDDELLSLAAAHGRTVEQLSRPGGRKEPGIALNLA